MDPGRQMSLLFASSDKAKHTMFYVLTGSNIDSVSTYNEAPSKYYHIMETAIGGKNAFTKMLEDILYRKKKKMSVSRKQMIELRT